MSDEEILREKRCLEETLDPSIIQFLKSKKSKESEKKLIEQIDPIQHNDILGTNEMKTDIEMCSDKDMKISDSSDNVKMDCKDENASNIPESPKKILEQSKQEGWLHMNTLELEKLQWMEDLPAEKKDEPIPNKEYNARFDFNGE